MASESLQQRSPAWHLARRGKLTASNLGAALGQVSYISRQQAYRRATGVEKFEGNVATEWGNDNEPNGIMEYERISGAAVVSTGLHIHPVYSWLAGSPDGLIGSDGVIEVKCPYYKKQPHQEVPGHYWMQCNALMEITRRAWCDYVCWTPNGVTIHRIMRDKDTFDFLLPHYGQFYAAMQRESPTVPIMHKEVKELIQKTIYGAIQRGVRPMTVACYTAPEHSSDPYEDVEANNVEGSVTITPAPSDEDTLPSAKRRKIVSFDTQRTGETPHDPEPTGHGQSGSSIMDEST